MFELKEYVSREGRIPFSDWLNRLRNVQARGRIRVRLDRIRLGNLGDIRSVGEGIHELRIAHGPGYRIYFTWLGQQTILLLCGGDKGTQKRDIFKAKEYSQDYRRRRNAD